MNQAPSIDTEPSVDDVVYPTIRLTQDDVRQLIEKPDVDSKIEILEKVSRHFSPEKFNDSEMAIAEQIFRLLLHDSTIRVRKALADNLKDNPHIPKDIALSLSNDLESVATPMLVMSQVLDDQDLVNIIQHSAEIWRYLAIASRNGLSEKVSGALVETELQDVIHRLLDNPSALISEESMHKIIDHEYAQTAMADKLALRPSLPLAIVEKLLYKVSEEIGEHLKHNYQMDPEQVEAETRHAKEQTTLDIIITPQDRENTFELVTQLYETGRLTSSLIINALCHGNIDFFEMSLAKLANIPADNAHILISDSGKLGFRALYNKSQLPPSMYKAVRLLLDSVRSTLADGMKAGSNHFSNHVIERMLTVAEMDHIDNLPYILAILRQKPSFD